MTKNQNKKSANKTSTSMTFREYDGTSRKSDGFSKDRERSLQISLVELVQESLRLQQNYSNMNSDEKTKSLGDILWYVANISRCSGSNIDEVARKNIEYIQKHYLVHTGIKKTDLAYEELPKKISFLFYKDDKSKVRMFTGLLQGEALQIGDSLTDNSYESDFYAFHDVFHLSLAAHLGWSPVIRSLLRRKRKSDDRIDEVEDGARAAIIEESISALVFQRYSLKLKSGEKIELSLDTLRQIRELVLPLEAAVFKYEEWETAILEGFRVFQSIKGKNCIVVLDRSSHKKLDAFDAEDSDLEKWKCGQIDFNRLVFSSISKGNSSSLLMEEKQAVDKLTNSRSSKKTSSTFAR